MSFCCVLSVSYNLSLKVTVNRKFHQELSFCVLSQKSEVSWKDVQEIKWLVNLGIFCPIGELQTRPVQSEQFSRSSKFSSTIAFVL